MSSPMIALNVCVSRNLMYTALEFEELSLVADVCCYIRRLPITEQDDEQFGLFKLHQDPTKCCWLRMDKTLKDCCLKNGDSLEYRTRIRPLDVKTLDKLVTVIPVDDGQSVQRITQSVCSKLGLSNHEEFTLTVDRSNNDDDAPCSLNGKMVNWLISEKTLQEQGVPENTAVTLRKRFFFSDLNLDQSDSVKLNLTYIQSRDTIVDGTLSCTKEEAISLAALQCHIQYGKYDSSNHTPGFLTLTDFIPKVYTSVRHVEALICNEHQRLLDIDKEEAKYKYIQLCYSLPTFGITFFLVQERRHTGKKMDTIRLLGVGRNNVVRLDVKRKSIISTWPLSTIRRWTYCTDTFSLDFGQYPTKVYTAKTTEGEIISDFLSSYVNIVLGSHHKLSDLVTDTIPVTDDHFYEMVTSPGENKIAMQDCPAYNIGKRT